AERAVLRSAERTVLSAAGRTVRPAAAAAAPLVLAARRRPLRRHSGTPRSGRPGIQPRGIFLSSGFRVRAFGAPRNDGGFFRNAVQAIPAFAGTSFAHPTR